ncbi:hypothetical protein JMJ55_27805 [Belnapia sp. T6]|uniref:Uncharacterized protein n=1 Tax=Belnapia mucosa TaxID=2804532 RepID=A0ABS1VBY3_9PROT|nr:hypothetical protein [Belnapia mucosa]MBL6459132.1 hypothetical protein [Belnapia mucosa]
MHAGLPAEAWFTGIEAVDFLSSEAELLATLRRLLLTSGSATRAPEAWCDEHRIGFGSIHAERDACQHARPDELLDALVLAPGEALRHRRVTLTRGEVELSDCDLLWLPARLDPAMVAEIEKTNTPFGAIIAPLRPKRRTLFEATLPAGGAHVLEHRAVVLGGFGECRRIAAGRELHRAALVPPRPTPFRPLRRHDAMDWTRVALLAAALCVPLGASAARETDYTQDASLAYAPLGGEPGCLARGLLSSSPGRTAGTAVSAGGDLIAFCRPRAWAAEPYFYSSGAAEIPTTFGQVVLHMHEQRATGARSADELRAAMRRAGEVCGEGVASVSAEVPGQNRAPGNPPARISVGVERLTITPVLLPSGAPAPAGLLPGLLAKPRAVTVQSLRQAVNGCDKLQIRQRPKTARQ